MAIHRRVLPTMKCVVYLMILYTFPVVTSYESGLSMSRLRTRSVNIHSRILEERMLMVMLAVWSSKTMTRSGVRIRTAALLPSLGSSHYSASSWTRCVHVKVAGLAYFSGGGLAYLSGGCQGASVSTECSVLTVSDVDEQGGCPTFPKLTITLRGGELVKLPHRPGERPGCPPTTQPRHQPLTGARLSSQRILDIWRDMLG